MKKSRHIVNCVKCGKPVRILKSNGSWIVCEPKAKLIYPSENGKKYYKGNGTVIKGNLNSYDGFECYEAHICSGMQKG